MSSKLMSAYMLAVVAGEAWPVAREHYLRVTDRDFEEAAKPIEEAAQNATQQDTELPHKNSQPHKESAFCDKKRSPAMLCEVGMGPPGFEPGTNGL